MEMEAKVVRGDENGEYEEAAANAPRPLGPFAVVLAVPAAAGQATRAAAAAAADDHADGHHEHGVDQRQHDDRRQARVRLEQLRAPTYTD